MCSPSKQQVNHIIQAVFDRTASCLRYYKDDSRLIDSNLFASGLLVKQALIEARKATHDLSILQIYNNSHGVIFFGTPHRGSDMASWGLLLKNIAQVALMDTNDAILIDLDPKRGSSKLEELRLDFDDVLRDSQRTKELRVFSFQEEQGMTGVSLLSGKVSKFTINTTDPSKGPQK